MICLSGFVNSTYAWELNLFNKVRSWRDGLSCFEFDIGADWFRADHNPNYGVCLVVMNYMVVEFRVYNINHVEDEK